MAIAGSFSLDRDAPVDADRMLRAIARADPRGWRRWRGEGVALAASDDTRLATAPGGRVALVDGQIHNRGELAAFAGCDAALDDARLLLAAFERAGDDLPDRVVGDVAFAIWDDRARRLLAAVDPGGYRPLAFAETPTGLIIASEARALLTDPAIERAIDEPRIAEWLALLAPEDASRTLYRGVRRVPPGALATWTPSGVAVRRWWRPEQVPMLTLPRHEDYVEAVRDSLTTAVGDRIGEGAVGSHLSGGLDSGVVTAAAAAMLARDGRRLTAFTAAPDRPFRPRAGTFGDEWPHAAAVAARYPNIDHVRIANDATTLDELQQRREPGQDVPLFNVHNSAWIDAIDRTAAARGIGVMLTGEAGNMTFSYDGVLLPSLLFHRGRPGRAVRALLDARRVQRWSWRRTTVALAYAALPVRWMRIARGLARRTVATPDAYSLIDPGFARERGIAARWEHEGGNLIHLHPHDSRALRIAVLTGNPVQGEFAAATRRLHGVDPRDPTRDRRLFELCLSIPEDRFLYRGLPRAIARGIAGALLPAAVAQEHRRGRQAADWAHTIDAMLPVIAADVASLRRTRGLPGWIDLDRIDRTIARWPGAEHVTDDDAIEWTAVTRAVAAGRFVRRVSGGNA